MKMKRMNMSTILGPGKSSQADPPSAAGRDPAWDLPEKRTGLSDLVKSVRAMPRPTFWWHYRVARLWSNRRFRQAGFVALVLVFAASFSAELSSWTRSTFASIRVPASVRAPAASYLGTLQQPVRERAAFFIRDEFEKGLERWDGAGSSLSPAGYLRVNGLTLHNATMKLRDYRLDFDFRIEAGMLGWVVRAADDKNYYAFELRRDNARDDSGYQLRRYLFSNGRRAESSLSDLSLGPAGNDLNHMSVRVSGDTIQTLFNGSGVDRWKENRYSQGGVGFYGGPQDTALVRRVTVRGNEDVLGLFLYGTMETMRSVREFLAAPLAFTLKPVPGGPAF